MKKSTATSRVRNNALRNFEHHMGVSGSDANPELLDEWVRRMNEQQLAAQTIRTYSFFMRKQVPHWIANIPKAKKVIRTLEIQITDVQRLYHAIGIDSERSMHDMALVSSIIIGMNLNNIRSLRWCDISIMPILLREFIEYWYQITHEQPKAGEKIFCGRGTSWMNLPKVNLDLNDAITTEEINRRLRKYLTMGHVPNAKNFTATNLRRFGRHIMQVSNYSQNGLVSLFLPSRKELDERYGDLIWLRQRRRKNRHLQTG